MGKRTRERRIAWLAGAYAAMAGEVFAVNPYGPPPNYANANWARADLGRLWADGYWWARKARR